MVLIDVSWCVGEHTVTKKSEKLSWILTKISWLCCWLNSNSKEPEDQEGVNHPLTLGMTERKKTVSKSQPIK